jgi:glycerate 2-kinase
VDRAFERNLQIREDTAGAQLLIAGQHAVALDRLRHMRIVAIGKASSAMLDALLARLPLPAACNIQGILIAPLPPQHLPTFMQYFCGGHPLPNQASFAGATAALTMLHRLADESPEDAACIFLISGGASAMMELPLDPSITLADTIAFHRALVASGATIIEMNCVRKHFSAVKGGRLALAAGNAQKISLLVSDVPPSNIDALASGPSIADPTTIAECREVIERYSLLDRFPASVSRFFASPNLPETPKPGELHSPAWKLLDSDELANTARLDAASHGFHVVIDNTCDDWTFEAAADYLLDQLRHLRQEYPRICLISVGEVAVKLPHDLSPTAKGGRNQHLALYLATQLTHNDGSIAILSAGSDGIDGNSIAAGAVIDQNTINTPEDHTEAQRALQSCGSFNWLNAHNAALVTGPTGHILRDLRILLAEPPTD